MIVVNLVIRNNTNVTLDNIERISDVEVYSDYQRLIVRKCGKKIILYDSNMTDIKPGDTISFNYTEKEAYSERVEGGFNYNEYLINNNYLNKTYTINNVSLIKQGFSINLIKYYLFKYIDKIFNNLTRTFIKGLVLGNSKDFDDDFYDSIKDNGIVHLFAISGLHIGLIVFALEKLLNRFKNKTKVIVIMLSIYLVITSFASSILRAVLMYFLSVINKKYKLKFSSSDVISIVLLILLMINPNYIYNSGFILSFLISTMIILESSLIKNKHKIIQALIITASSNVLVLPIIINMNNEYNLLSVVTSVLFIFLVSYFYLPLTFISLMLPFISKVSEFFFSAFVKISSFFSNYLSINIICKEVDKIGVALYYTLILSILYLFKNGNIKMIYKKLLIGTFSCFIIFLFLNTTLKKEVHFLDLDEGEATLIIDRECKALIDTGDGKNDEVLKLLKRKGIKHLDYLILTHPHLDHVGGYEKIKEDLKIDNLVVSFYDNSDYGMETAKLKSGDMFSCGKNSFRVISPSSNYKDENDNGLVLYSEIGGLKMLFLADVSKRVEEKIANLNLSVDLIKIAHHGSSTSTSPILIERYLPKYAIIEAGRNNKFSFPNKKTIETLNKYKVEIYRTDLDYSIIYKFGNGKNRFIKMSYK